MSVKNLSPYREVNKHKTTDCICVWLCASVLYEIHTLSGVNDVRLCPPIRACCVF